MGKAVLILVIGSITVVSLFSLNIIGGVNRSTDTAVDQFNRKQARLIANSLVNIGLSKLSDNPEWRQDSPYPETLMGGSGSYRVVDTVFEGTDIVKISTQGIVNGETVFSTALVNKPVVTGGGVALDYAIISESDLTFSGSGSTWLNIGDYMNPSLNASVHSNMTVDIASIFIKIEGFVTYGNIFKNNGANTIIAPNSNPNGDPLSYKVPPVDIPTLDLAALKSKADVFISKAYSLPGGTLDLGTIDNPKIIYVAGQLDIASAVNVNGYGIIVCEANCNIKANFLDNASLSPNCSKVQIVAGGSVDVRNIEAHASVYALGNITLNTGNCLLVGNLVAKKGIILSNKTVTVAYQPVASKISEILWGIPPSAGDRLTVIHWYE